VFYDWRSNRGEGKGNCAGYKGPRIELGEVHPSSSLVEEINITRTNAGDKNTLNDVRSGKGTGD